MKVPQNHIETPNIEKVNTPESIAQNFVDCLNVKEAQKFILRGESTGNKDVDYILNDSTNELYYLLEDKIESLRKNKDFNLFYEKHYEEQIDNTKENIVNMLGKK
ncbi:hypothetical protein [Candidatus Uabimicrobium sp. HlEnr_7]|uniref:hypothetical protein n=1 Tax=Candidatus Uabimicrobium helgolandensis TaxID=3095367 RepID=UPI003557A16B